MLRPLQPGVFGGAQFVTFDGVRVGRLRLDRWWDETLVLADHGRHPADDRYHPLVIIGMNPSEADGEGDDPTIGKDITYARREGANGLVKVNAHPGISKDPKGLGRVLLPYGSDEEQWKAVESALCEDAVSFVAAWGNCPPGISPFSWQDRVRKIREIALDVGRELVCFGENKNGSPKHPLYLRADLPLVRYRWGDA